jgi:hypothetical protein
MSARVESTLRLLGEPGGSLLERGAELARLSGYVEAIEQGGAGRVALLGGEAGVGKTVLVEALLAAHPGLNVVRGECEPLYLAQVDRNAHEGVTWLHSYVSDDGRTYCVLDGPSPEAIRKAAAHSRLPVGRITEVRVLDPYLRV